MSVRRGARTHSLDNVLKGEVARLAVEAVEVDLELVVLVVNVVLDERLAQGTE